MSEAGEGQENRQQRARADECKKVPIIPSAHAIVEPDAVMILGLDTVVAGTTMMTSQRTPDVASLAILGRNINS